MTATATSTAVAPRPIKTALAMLNDARERIAPFIPKGYTFERIMGEVGLAVKENPKIADCTPESVVRAVIRALRMDLEIGIEFHLVPFDQRNGPTLCTGIAGYRGLANLAVRCGAARSVQAHALYENEEFQMEHGLNPILRHVKEKDAKRRGAMLGAYYIVNLPRGADPLFDFLPLADIDAVREKSKQWNPTKVRECPPWWAKKRAVLVGLSLVPKNVRFAEAMARIDQWDDTEEATTKTVDGDAPQIAAPAATREPGEESGGDDLDDRALDDYDLRS